MNERAMNARATSLEDALREARPAPPPGLERACRRGTVEAAARAGGAIDVPDAAPRPRWPWHGVAAAAAVLAVAAIVVVRTANPPAPSAEATLGAGLEGLDAAEAIVLLVETDRGPGTPRRVEYQVTSRRGFGTRIDFDDGATLYGEHARRIAQYDAAADRVEIIAIEEDRSMASVIGRADAMENLLVLHALAARDRGEVTAERVPAPNGDPEGAVLRLVGPDARGLPFEVEVDPRRELVLRTVETLPEDHGGGRVISTFAYPDPATIDPRIFDPRAIDAAEVVEITGILRARRQVMVDVRSLLMMVATYAAEYDGAMPPDLGALAPYANRPLPWYLLTDLPGEDGPVMIRSRLDEVAGRRYAELPPDEVLFDCRFPEGDVLGFADGHVEFRMR